MKKLLTTTALAAIMQLPAMAGTFEIPEDKVRLTSRLPEDTSTARLFFDEGKFTVRHQGATKEVADANLRGFPLGLETEALQTFFNSGGVVYLREGEDDNYSLEARQRALGGASAFFTLFCRVLSAGSAITWFQRVLRHVTELSKNDVLGIDSEDIASALRETSVHSGITAEQNRVILEAIRKLEDGDEELGNDIKNWILASASRR